MTQDDLDRLEKALAQGTKRVTFSDGRSVEYNSFEELTKRIQFVRKQLGQDLVEKRLLGRYTKGVEN